MPTPSAPVVRVPVSKFETAIIGLNVTAEERNALHARIPADRSAVTLYLNEHDKPLLAELLKYRIAKNVRTRITQFVHRYKGQTNKQIQSLVERLQETVESFDQLLHHLQDLQGAPFEVRILKQWYRFTLPKLALYKRNKLITGLVIPVVMQMVRERLELFPTVHDANFGDLYRDKTLQDILLDLGIRPVTSALSPEHDHTRLLSLAIGLAEDYGAQVTVQGEIVEIRSEEGRGLYAGEVLWRTNRTIFEAEKCVVEPELEIQPGRISRGGSDDQPHGVLPFVRLFSLKNRTYYYTDVRNVTRYAYNTNVDEQIVLDPSHRQLLQQIFDLNDQTIRDLIPGKTSSICVFAYGTSGTGKTLTAEVYAEIKERPLYPLSVSEIGTTPKDIEKNLQRVFSRVERWNAVLLFDECDVFLSRRGEDIEQAAIVGMFLRLLDYYQGTLFLTTNRSATLDEAIDSRIGFRLHYPKLTVEQRSVIWGRLLAKANLATTPEDVQALAQHDIDGRRILNTVRAMQITRQPAANEAAFQALHPYLTLQSERA